MNGIDLNIFECNGPDLTDYDLYMCEARASRNIDKLLRVVWCRIILITLQFTWVVRFNECVVLTLITLYKVLIVYVVLFIVVMWRKINDST